MHFSMTEEQELAVDSFARFLKAEIQPIVDEHQESKYSGQTMREIVSALLPYGMGNGLVSEVRGNKGRRLRVCRVITQ